MSGALDWSWVMILLLGVWHGINPGMGWLFAVALGLQERKGAAVWRALPPLALGHAAAIGAALLVALLLGMAIPLDGLKWVVAALLLGFGLFRLLSSRHPRYGGMQVGARDLTVWSFLMGSAHGAGLMVVPFVLDAADAANGAAVHMAGHSAHADPLLAGAGSEQVVAMLAMLVHTAGYLIVTGLLALVVYRKLGLRLLRTAWLNLDIVWAAALIVTALVTPFL